MVSGKSCVDVQRTGKWLCAVRNKSVLCSECDGWVHKCCSGVNGSVSKTGESFVCNVWERARDGEDINIQQRLGTFL